MPLHLFTGDVHGDITSLVQCLRMAGLVGFDLRWTGGKSYLVQVGDLLDRGDDEYTVLALLKSLGREARAQGGGVICLLGNHEVISPSLSLPSRCFFPLRCR